MSNEGLFAPEKKNADNKLVCAHYISKYLSIPENWIYKIIINHTAYSPIFLTRKKENLDLFPFAKLRSLDDLSKPRQYLEILVFKIFGYFNFFATFCTQHRAEILHVHFGYHGVKMIGLKNKLKIPMLCSFYGDDAYAYPRSAANRQRYKTLFAEADRILVLGVNMKNELIKLGCSEHKIIIHHLGINVEAIKFSKREITKGNPVRFLIASSFVKKKGIDLAIKALSYFKNSHDFFLDIIGDGVLKNALLKVIEESGIQDRIKLYGYRPYSDFIDMAYNCDVFIQASRTTEQGNKEGTPMAIVDAMATGMIVISTKHSDIPEIVIDGKNGYLAEENDVESLRACIQKIFDNANDTATMSLNGREWIEKEFDAKKQSVKLESYYTELISKHSSQ